MIQARLKSGLPTAAMMPRDLREAALKRIEHASRLFGEIRIEGSSFIAPVWRPLIEALREIVPVEWIAPAEADSGWFRGKITRSDPSSAGPPAVFSCADVRHEVGESLRWARQLIVSGLAWPNEIAITSPNTTPWDNHFLACAEDTGFRLHFSHGVSALATSSDDTLAVYGYAEQNNIPFIADTGTPQITEPGTKYTFRVYPTENLGIGVAVAKLIAAKTPGARVALMYSDYAFNRTVNSGFKYEASKRGLNVISEVVLRRSAFAAT